MLRPFQGADLDQVMHINFTCLPENYTPQFFLDLYNSFPNAFLVAAVRDKIAGYIMCRIEVGFPETGGIGIVKKGHIVSLAVLPECRRMGVGEALTLKAMDAMSDYGAKECFLEVRVSNLPATNLYEKLGFRTAKKCSGYYSDGESALVMARKLGTDVSSQAS